MPSRARTRFATWLLAAALPLAGCYDGGSLHVDVEAADIDWQEAESGILVSGYALARVDSPDGIADTEIHLYRVRIHHNDSDTDYELSAVSTPPTPRDLEKGRSVTLAIAFEGRVPGPHIFCNGYLSILIYDTLTDGLAEGAWMTPRTSCP
ncbi:MAG: hypothetical protein R3B72_35435 [Polyangiaceae bacterium]